MFSVSTGSGASDIDLITNRSNSVTVRAGVRLIGFDTPANIEADLSARLSPDAEQAFLIVQQRLKTTETDMQRRLAAAYLGVADAWSLGIVKIPAVVVDQQYVVYGESNVDRAVAMTTDYRSAHP